MISPSSASSGVSSAQPNSEFPRFDKYACMASAAASIVIGMIDARHFGSCTVWQDVYPDAGYSLP